MRSIAALAISLTMFLGLPGLAAPSLTDAMTIRPTYILCDYLPWLFGCPR
jgi:hypothetical protein